MFSQSVYVPYCSIIILYMILLITILIFIHTLIFHTYLDHSYRIPILLSGQQNIISILDPLDQSVPAPRFFKFFRTRPRAAFLESRGMPGKNTLGTQALLNGGNRWVDERPKLKGGIKYHQTAYWRHWCIYHHFWGCSHSTLYGWSIKLNGIACMG